MNEFLAAVLIVACCINSNFANSEDYDYEVVFSATPRKPPSSTTTSRPEPAVTEWVEDVERCDLDEKCVRYYLCKEDRTINSDGSFLIDERLDNSNAGEVSVQPCPNMEMCCVRGKVLSKPENVCDGSTFPAPAKCGFHNPKGLGGTAKSMQNNTLYAQYSEFPWQVAILATVSGSNVFKMGGALIHPSVVLTTAHHIIGINPSKLVIRAGEWDTNTESEMCPHEERQVQSVIIHERFNRQNLHNDLVLLILKQEFKMTAFINTVCLPPKNMQFAGQRCYSGGWGTTKFGAEEVFQVFLKKIELPVLTAEKGEKLLRLTCLGEDFELHEGLLTAGGEKDKDLCTGDGGSPLVCESQTNPGHFYAAGMVVGGINCGKESVPGLYANLSFYRDWIDAKMASLGLDNKYYTL